MTKPSRKRIALHKLSLTKRTVEALKPGAKSWIAWDDTLTGFGVRVQPTGLKAYIVNYRAGDGGRKAPNKRVVLGRHGEITAAQARHMAQLVLREAATGDGAGGRTEADGMPVLEQAFEDYMAVNPKRTASTNKQYRQAFGHLSDWRLRPLDAIGRRDIEDRFNSLTRNHGWASANQSISLLGAIYRRPCVDFEGLRNPVDLWRAGGGKYHRPKRRKISAPAEVLPRWKKGIEAEAIAPVARDAFRFGLYTGMRLNEVLPLRWERVDMAELVFRVDETKTGAPLALPITRQLAAILERRQAHNETVPGGLRDWVFPSSASATGHVVDLAHFYDTIGETGGTKFWYHALRNCFITVAERDLLLPRTLTKRLVNHARPNDITEGYAADWTIGQLREPAQGIADRIDALMNATVAAAPSNAPWQPGEEVFDSRE